MEAQIIKFEKKTLIKLISSINSIEFADYFDPRLEGNGLELDEIEVEAKANEIRLRLIIHISYFVSNGEMIAEPSFTLFEIKKAYYGDMEFIVDPDEAEYLKRIVEQKKY